MKTGKVSKSVCEENNYREVYNQNGKLIRNFIYYKCGDLSHAEDITHEAFIKLWEKCASVIITKAKSFLYTVANRIFIDSLRHKKVALNFISERSSIVDLQDPDYLLRETEFKDILQKAISDLPENQREVFLMNRIDKMTYSEIADALDLSVKAVEKRMHLALETLKDRIKELNIHKI
jgi:RNA polymerase sigma-70 factor (ECF subfamily)